MIKSSRQAVDKVTSQQLLYFQIKKYMISYLLSWIASFQVCKP